MKRKITVLACTLLTLVFAIGAYASNTSCDYQNDKNTELLRMATNSAMVFGIDPQDIKSEYHRILVEEKKFINLTSNFSFSYLFNCGVDSTGTNYSSMREALVDYISNY